VSYITISLTILCILLTCALSLSVYFNVKHGLLLLRIQDSIESSLDVLDIKYSRISEILEIPIFFDSVEVRQVISEIQDARDSILHIANKITEVSTITDKREPENDTD